MHFVGRLLRRHRPQVDAADHGGTDVRVGEAKDAAEDAAGGHVGEPPAVDVNDLVTDRLLVVGRPLPGRVHLAPLGQQLGSARNDRFGLPVEPLAALARGLDQAEQLSRVVATNAFDIAVVQTQAAAGLLECRQRLDAD